MLSQLLTVMNLEQYTSFRIKSFSVVPHFYLPLFFFSCGTSLVQTISKKPNQTSLCQSPKPLLTSFPLKKLIDSIAKLHMKKLKLDQVNNCIFFLNCYCQHELRFPALYPHIIFNFLRHSCSLENGKKIIYCIVSLEYLRL